jgi:hypothetical protein
VRFPPQAGAGTYSYRVGPGVIDLIRDIPGGVRATSLGGSIGGNAMDQDADGTPAEGDQDAYAAPRPAGNIPFSFPYDPTTLPLIVPGPHVVASRAVGAGGVAVPPQLGGENLILDGPITALEVTFDRAMRPETFTAADVLQVVGPPGRSPARTP